VAASLGEAVLRVVADIRGLSAGLAKGQAKIRVFAGKVKTIGVGLNKLGKQALVTGLALAGMFAPAILAGAKFEQTMAGVKAVMTELQTGTVLAAQSFAALEKKAQELGATTKFSASEVASAMEFLGLAGFTAQQTLDGVEATLSLAAAGALELGRAADIASDTMTAFNLQAQDLGRVADVMATTASNANTTIELLGSSFRFVAPIAATLGQSIEDVSTALGVLANAGIKGSVSGTGLAQIFGILAKKGDDLNGVLEKYGLTFADINPEVVSLRDILAELERVGLSVGDAMEIFGARAGRSLVSLIKQGVGAFDDLKEANEGATGAAERMAAIRMDTVTGEWLKFKAAVEGMNIKIFEAIREDLVKLLTVLREVSVAVTDWVVENKGLVKWAGIVTVALVSLGSALIALGVVIKIAVVAMGGLALIMSPWLLVILAVVAAVVALSVAFVKLSNALNASAIEKQAKAAAELNRQAKVTIEQSKELVRLSKERGAEDAKALALLREFGSLTVVQLKQLEELTAAGAADLEQMDARWTLLLLQGVELQRQIIALDQIGEGNSRQANELRNELKIINEVIRVESTRLDTALFMRDLRQAGVAALDGTIEKLETQSELLEKQIKQEQDVILNLEFGDSKRSKLVKQHEKTVKLLERINANLKIARNEDKVRLSLLREFNGDLVKLREEEERRAKVRRDGRRSETERINDAERLAQLEKDINRKQLEGLDAKLRDIKELREEREKDIAALERTLKATVELRRQEIDESIRGQEAMDVRISKAEALTRAEKDLARVQKQRHAADLAALEAENKAIAEQVKDRRDFLEDKRIDDLRLRGKNIEALKLLDRREREDHKKMLQEKGFDEQQAAELTQILHRKQAERRKEAFFDADEREPMVKAAERQANIEEELVGALGKQVRTVQDLFAAYWALNQVRLFQENLAKRAADDVLIAERRIENIEKRRDKIKARDGNVDALDFQIERLRTQLGLMKQQAGIRAGAAQLGDAAGQAAVLEVEQLKEKLAEAQRQFATMRGDIIEDLRIIQEAFGQAPDAWVDSFLASWEAASERMVEAVRQTMAAIKELQKSDHRESPSLIDIWDANVQTVKQGINQMTQSLQQNMPNLGQLNMSQAMALQPKGMSVSGFGGDRAVTREFTDNRRVQMDIHNNVDIDNVKRQIGLSLSQVDMEATV
jgi:TP901 family phage tail tape measure protein